MQVSGQKEQNQAEIYRKRLSVLKWILVVVTGCMLTILVFSVTYISVETKESPMYKSIDTLHNAMFMTMTGMTLIATFISVVLLTQKLTVVFKGKEFTQEKCKIFTLFLCMTFGYICVVGLNIALLYGNLIDVYNTFCNPVKAVQVYSLTFVCFYYMFS